MIILGLNAFHGDSSAALVEDGELIAAAEEERFRRIKHWAGLPTESVKYCLSEKGVTLDDIDLIALNQDTRANFWRRIHYLVRTRPGFDMVLQRVRTRMKRQNIIEMLLASFPGQSFTGQLINIEHHQAHLSSAFHVSPFNEAVAVSVDGFGDFASGAWGIARGTGITVTGKVYFPHSLGIFYQALTQFLGFPHYGDEYKVMGLAPYGQPEYMEAMRNIVQLNDDGGYSLNLDFFCHDKQKMDFQWQDGVPVFSPLYSEKLELLLGKKRLPEEELEQVHRDIASSVQAMYEEAFFHLLNTLYKRHACDHVVLAGGCAMNSVANGKIYRRTPFKKAYVQSAAGDAGGAVGAAFSAWYQSRPGATRNFVMEHAYWGPEFHNDEVKQVLDNHKDELERNHCKVSFIENEIELCRKAAEAVSEGKVVGWFQGRMEWGPRALGNRSIVCDPRRKDMKDILNRKIKRRESFRPFAPSVLREHVAGWFEEDDDVPFMMKVFQIREDKRELVPAVTHVDGSGRLQTVTRDSNELYYNLIREFMGIAGVPMVLNTSFNENEPVVCKPEEALACFVRTDMDVLFVNHYMVVRENHRML
ncbi:MAG TPA: carbamoyltransferase C-terminal domain-containing protein [Gammaproteobacteria bacterium]|nr:carbamoyltransferase C-terminal domain-containing protein [Gammaproteobacteria bacterium]